MNYLYESSLTVFLLKEQCYTNMNSYFVKFCIKLCFLCNFSNPWNDLIQHVFWWKCLLCNVYIATFSLKFSHGQSEVRHY